MNRTSAAVLACLLTAAQMLSAANVIDNYIKHRFNAETVQVKDIQGLSQRISDGKLHLRLKDFLELVLKNSTDVQLTRLDVYTAAYQIMAAKAPFDPTLGLQINTLRAVTPLFFSTGGGNFSGQTSGTGTGTGQTGQGGGTGAAGGVTQITLPQTINSLSQNSTVTY